MSFTIKERVPVQEHENRTGKTKLVHVSSHEVETLTAVEWEVKRCLTQSGKFAITVEEIK